MELSITTLLASAAMGVAGGALYGPHPAKLIPELISGICIWLGLVGFECAYVFCGGLIVGIFIYDERTRSRNARDARLKPFRTQQGEK